MQQRASERSDCPTKAKTSDTAEEHREPLHRQCVDGQSLKLQNFHRQIGSPIPWQGALADEAIKDLPP